VILKKASPGAPGFVGSERAMKNKQMDETKAKIIN
jgi:hypothetical protein